MARHVDLRLGLARFSDWEALVSTKGVIYRHVFQFKQGDVWTDVARANLEGNSDEYPGWPKPGFYRIRVYDTKGNLRYPSDAGEEYSHYEDHDHPAFAKSDSGGDGGEPSRLAEAKTIALLFDTTSEQILRLKRALAEAESRAEKERREKQTVIDGMGIVQKEKQAAELQSAEDVSLRMRAEYERDMALARMREMVNDRATFGPEIEAFTDSLVTNALTGIGMPDPKVPHDVRRAIEDMAALVVFNSAAVRIFVDGGMFLLQEKEAPTGVVQVPVEPLGQAFWDDVRVIVHHYKNVDLGDTPVWKVRPSQSANDATESNSEVRVVTKQQDEKPAHEDRSAEYDSDTRETESEPVDVTESMAHADSGEDDVPQEEPAVWGRRR